MPTSDENKILWQHVIPDEVKRAFSRLLRLGLLGWDQLLEARRRLHPHAASAAALSRRRPTQDGNLLWEIGWTEVPEWIEPQRWRRTLVSFLRLLAWEHSVGGAGRLYPTARLQVRAAARRRAAAARPPAADAAARASGGARALHPRVAAPLEALRRAALADPRRQRRRAAGGAAGGAHRGAV